jgi:hypothetical protein
MSLTMKTGSVVLNLCNQVCVEHGCFALGSQLVFPVHPPVLLLLLLLYHLSALTNLQATPNGLYIG